MGLDIATITIPMLFSINGLHALDFKNIEVLECLHNYVVSNDNYVYFNMVYILTVANLWVRWEDTYYDTWVNESSFTSVANSYSQESNIND